jgi:hypothetical protein
MDETLNAADQAAATMACLWGMPETATIKGRFSMECHDGETGELLWREDFDNVVCTPGKNVLLDAGLAGSAYTVVGPFLGLISSTSFSAVAAADTLASHAGWLEAGTTNSPTYAARLTCAWNAASGGAKALSAPLAFTMTGGGTVQGAFLVYGTGAVATNLSTTGTLFSAGTFATPQPVIAGNVVSAAWSVTI